ncbi:non-ribosomal peptide synthetase [uncultured Enterococcus sp.]|uniref:non-ribosomal peptide synthetase n=1 Tax=uncultured Enterococcus sp. TaxID=167972 RepID=UPI002AA88AB5|nr:non-ribosomal peptide synthetase [uncultured Enterococcus sp.]
MSNNGYTKKHNQHIQLDGNQVNSLCEKSGLTRDAFFANVFLILMCKTKGNNAYSMELVQKNQFAGTLTCTIPTQGTLLDALTAATLKASDAEEQPNDGIKGIVWSSEMSADLQEQILCELLIQVNEDAEQNLLIDYFYSSEVYEEEEIDILHLHFQTLLTAILQNEHGEIAAYDIVSQKERDLLAKVNQTDYDFSTDACVHEIIENTVKKYPNKTALVYEGEEITFEEFNRRANQIAAFLKKQEIQAGDYVAIMAVRGIELICSIFGVLKSGAAYVPMNPIFPVDRLRFMLEDSQAKMILSTGCPEELSEFCPIVDLNDSALYEGNAGNPGRQAGSDDTLCLIYTSGTTGNPKSVKINHGAIVNYCEFNAFDFLKLNKDDRVPQFAPITFSTAISEITTTLLSGATLYLVTDEVIKNIPLFNEFINEIQATMCLLPPIYCDYVQLPKSVRMVETGGSACHKEAAERMVAQGAKYYNAYGLSEGTVISVWEHQPGEEVKKIPIGKPVANSKVYVMNGDKVNGLYMPGELCVTGMAVSNGYLNLSELNEKRFIPNPFGKGKMLKTGDIVQWNHKGELEYVGRSDNQVQIRGMRVELEEIEHSLLNDPAIVNVAAISRDDQHGETSIAAFVTSKEQLDIREMKKQLRKRLVDYMIPANIVQLETLPLTVNGKVDRKALETIPIEEQTNFVAPETAVEKQVAQFFEVILKTDTIGKQTDFFEAGGHSLRLTRLINSIESSFNIRLSIADIYEHSTVEAISSQIESGTHQEREMISPAEEKEFYALSSAQKQIYIATELDDTTKSYNVPVMLSFDGSLEKEKLTHAFQQLIERHDSLRTAFKTVDGKPVQHIKKAITAIVETEEVQEISTETAEQNFHSFVRPFDLQQAPLMRVKLFANQERSYLFIDVHHIISDGGSFNALIEEFSLLYSGQTLAPLPIQYKDYSEWQKLQNLDKQKQFWVEQFRDAPESLDLPLDYKRTARQSFKGHTVKSMIPAETRDALKKLAETTGTTEYMVLLSVGMIMLGKYSRQEDVVVGTSISGRTRQEIEKVQGIFVNTLAMRGRPTGEKTVHDFLQEVKETSLLAYQNQEFPFDELIASLDIPRDLSRNPLFDVMFVLQNNEQPEQHWGDAAIVSAVMEEQGAKFDLTFSISETSEGYELSLDYRTALFKEESMKIMLQHYLVLLQNAASNATQKIGELSAVNEEEKQRIMTQFNKPQEISGYKDQTIAEIFENQVALFPKKEAVIYQDQVLTYQELNNKANQLAHTLREAGIGTNDFVAVEARRAPATIIAILGIVKAGAAYVPIDSEYPEERVMYMLENCQAKAVLATDSFTHQAARLSLPFYSLNTLLEESASSDNPSVINKADDLLYLMYTSGTTGKPKGTMIEHRNVFHLLEDSEPVGLSSDTIMLQAGSLSFDAATFEIWGSLLKGGTLVLTDKENFLNSQLLKQTIEDYKINTLFLTTALFNQHIELEPHVFNHLDCLLFGGEKLSERHVRQLLEENQHTQLLHVYGPTEGTTFSEFHLIQKEELDTVVPIGKPFPTTTAYILSDDGTLCGVGMKGELYIGGTGLAKGYWQNPELTDKVFVDSPFGRLYRTGDLAKWRANGSIDFLGRVDNQIKLRGFRVELEEITNTILRVTTIRQAITILTPEQRIAVYLSNDTSINIKELKEELRKTLPEYMLPELILQLDELPVAPTGKIDRNALPRIDELPVEQGLAPRNELESKIASVFSEVLGHEISSISTSFFDHGGHSLKAMQLLNKLEAELSTRIPLKDFFENPTIEGIGEKVEATASSTYERIEKAANQEAYPASSTQKRLYVIQEFDETGIAYNIPVGLSFNQEINLKKAAQCFEQLIERHEALRTSFYTAADGMVMQKIVRTDQVSFVIETGQMKTKDELTDILQSFVRPFDLSAAPLFRAGIITTSDGGSLFLLDIHHIIADGLSVQLLLKEFAALYNGHSLNNQELQYKDYSEWLRKRSMDEHEAFWKKELADDALPVLELPLDYRRPQQQTFAGATVSARIDSEMKEKLAELANKTGTTEYMILLAVYQILLHKYSRQEEIVVGTSVSGRTHADVESMLGMFVNTLVLKGKPEKQKYFTDFLAEIKEQNLQMLEHQDFPFEKIVELLDLPRSMSRNPLFDVMFVYQNQQDEEISLEGNQGTEIEAEGTIAKFDLSFRFTETAEEYQLIVEYAKDLFRAESIHYMLAHFLVLLEDVLTHSEKRISDLVLIDEQEKVLVLEEFNHRTEIVDLEQTVVSSFEEQVERWAEKPALVHQSQQISYKEFNQRANQVAHYLRANGVGRDDLVAVLAERSVEMLVCMLGIIKAGGAYVPIDPSAPEERREYLLTDSQPKALLTTFDLPEQLYGIPVVSAELETFHSFSTENPERINHSNDLLYCIYTSGTTGKPKGVLVEHKGILNVKQYFNKSLGLTSDDHMLQFSNYVFDASALEIFTALLNGSALHLVDAEDLKNPTFIENYLSEYISFAILPPQYAASIQINNVGTVMTGGSVATRKIVSKESGNTIEHYLNAYGPTEATVYTTSWSYRAQEGDIELPEQLPIGQPITNVEVHIIEEGQLCGVGIIGELCISGISLARGYLNQPELTAKAFIDHPFGEGKLYRSGDLARWMPDGQLEYLGRVDEQVKIRGYRIEPGEIESILRTAEFIQDAAVIVDTSEQEPKLAAYFVSETAIDGLEIQKYLATQLPEYMIPTAIMQLDEIPVTPNGKLDKKALPCIVATSTEQLIKPTNAIEEQLVQVFQEVLGLEEIGTNQHFLSLGGDSIKAIRIAAKIRENGYEILVKDILQYSTIAQISLQVQTTGDDRMAAAQAEQSGVVALTMVQQQLLNDSSRENHTLHLHFDTVIDEQLLTTAFDALIHHHDMLRAVYQNNQQELLRNEDTAAFQLTTTTHQDNLRQELVVQAEKDLQLVSKQEENLLNGHLLQFQEESHLVIGISPLIADRVSVQILLEDLITAYRSLAEKGQVLLSEKTLPFNTWIENNQLQQKGLSILSTVGELPETNASRNQLQHSIRETLSINQFETANQAFSTTTEELLLAGLVTAFEEWQQQAVCEVILEKDGRAHDTQAFNRTVGQFTELQPLQLQRGASLTETILQTKEGNRRVQKQADKEKVLELTNPVLFRLKDAEQVFLDTETEKLFSKTVDSRQLYTPCYADLELSITLNGTEVQLTVDYAVQVFSEEQIRAFQKNYENALVQLVDYCLMQEDSFRTVEDFDVFDMEADEIDLLNTLLD